MYGNNKVALERRIQRDCSHVQSCLTFLKLAAETDDAAGKMWYAGVPRVLLKRTIEQDIDTHARDILTQVIACGGIPLFMPPQNSAGKRPRTGEIEETNGSLPEASSVHNTVQSGIFAAAMPPSNLSNEFSTLPAELSELDQPVTQNRGESTLLPDSLSSLWFNPPQSFGYVSSLSPFYLVTY